MKPLRPIVSAIPHLSQFYGAWGMEPGRFRQTFNTLRTLDIEAHVREYRAQQQERRAAGGADDYQVTAGGVAIVNVVGELTKYGSSLSDAPGTIELRHTLRQLARNDRITGIVLRIDSPGGSIAGTDDLARDVETVGRVKPVVAFCEDLCASAAYWVASHATTLMVNPSGFVGSIGVYTVLEDSSEQAAAFGLRYHVVKSANTKLADEPGIPVTEETLSEVQKLVDQIHAMFIQAVAHGRRMKLEKVAELANGRVYTAREAKNARLVDRIGSLDDALELFT